MAPADEENKGSRVASRQQAEVFQASSFGLAEGVPTVPLQMKCEHCTRKVGAASGGTGGESQDRTDLAAGRARPRAPSFLSCQSLVAVTCLPGTDRAASWLRATAGGCTAGLAVGSVLHLSPGTLAPWKSRLNAVIRNALMTLILKQGQEAGGSL